MKRIFALILVVALSLALFSCGGEKEPYTSDPDVTTGGGQTTPPDVSTTAPDTTTPPDTTVASADPATCKHSFEVTNEIKPATTFTEGEGEYTCKLCGTKKTDVIPATKSIKILAIGNSFSQDAMEYLYDLLKAAGVEHISLGNLYIGGCSIDTHYNNSQTGANNYTYYYNTHGRWNSFKTNIGFGVTDEDWDIVTIQQASHDSGKIDTYANLGKLIDYVKSKVPEKTRIYWHMTWAYEKGSSHSGFASYNKDQMTMYNAIVNCVKEAVLKDERVVGIVPSGTAIQNLRTSYIGDNLTRDGYHMTYSDGRYTTGLTYLAAILGPEFVDNIKWIPASYPYIEGELGAIREAVKNAVANPYEVTQSTFTKNPSTPEPGKNNTRELTDAEKTLLKNKGYNPDDFLALDLKWTLQAYYHSASSVFVSNLVTSQNSTATNMPFFAATQIFEKDDIPSGSLIIIDNGYQYRPEGWTSLSTVTSPRPDNVTTEVVTVNNSWWGKFKYRAFNLSFVGSTTNIVESDTEHFHVFIAKNPSEEEIKVPTEEDLKDTSKYKELELNFTLAAFYQSNSTRSEIVTTSAISHRFAASQIFEKEELPVGTVIVVDDGYQYRPEAWTALGTLTSNRPGNVSEHIVVVDDAWWGSFNYRAFNLSNADNSSSITSSDTSHLRIYVPVKN